MVLVCTGSASTGAFLKHDATQSITHLLTDVTPKTKPKILLESSSFVFHRFTENPPLSATPTLQRNGWVKYPSSDKFLITVGGFAVGENKYNTMAEVVCQKSGRSDGGSYRSSTSRSRCAAGGHTSHRTPTWPDREPPRSESVAPPGPPPVHPHCRPGATSPPL